MSQQGPVRSHLRRLTLGSGPLKRTSDRIEALSRLLCTGLALLAVPVALAVGSVSWADTAQLAREQTATRTQVPAVLLEDVTSTTWSASDTLPAQAAARWTGPDGRTREGTIQSQRGVAAGDTVLIWVDERGTRIDRPLDTADVATVAVVSGVLTLVLSICAGVSAHLGVRWLLDRHRAREWERDWASVEPGWTGRA